MLSGFSDAVHAFIALGANLGDRAEALRLAVNGLLAQDGLMVVQVSPVYESPAHTLGSEDVQPPFLNAVAEVRTHLSPEALLMLCHRLEREAGRIRRRRWAPRPLDLDVLLYADATLDTKHLTIPHPRLAERRFVLQPLADLTPNLHVPPPFDASVADLLAHCPDPGPLIRTSIVLQARPAPPA